MIHLFKCSAVFRFVNYRYVGVSCHNLTIILCHLYFCLLIHSLFFNVTMQRYTFSIIYNRVGKSPRRRQQRRGQVKQYIQIKQSWRKYNKWENAGSISWGGLVVYTNKIILDNSVWVGKSLDNFPLDVLQLEKLYLYILLVTGTGPSSSEFPTSLTLLENLYLCIVKLINQIWRKELFTPLFERQWGLVSVMCSLIKAAYLTKRLNTSKNTIIQL